MAVESNRSRKRRSRTVEMPAPTAWPIVLAFGITLLFAGMVTSERRQRAGSDCRRRRRGWLVSRCSAA
jgi:hypothetical protein